MDRNSEITVKAGEKFMFIGEHTALDFANTLMAANGLPVETLVTWPDLLEWLEQAKLIGKLEKEVFTADVKSPAKQVQLLEKVRELRALWKKNLERLLAGKDVSPDLIKEINRLLRDDLAWQVLQSDSGTGKYLVHWEHGPSETGKRILALIADRMAHFLAESNLQYLRRCIDPECVLYFHDTTKSHRRQWCSMAICGNRHKVAKFRAKNHPTGNDSSPKTTSDGNRTN